jgi:hypothetical protein
MGVAKALQRKGSDIRPASESDVTRRQLLSDHSRAQSEVVGSKSKISTVAIGAELHRLRSKVVREVIGHGLTEIASKPVVVRLQFVT